MNLPLHIGFLGAIEAGLVAFVVGLFAFALWHWLCIRLRWSMGRALGWACVTAVVIAAGLDAWNLFYLGMMRLESPLYARIALQGIHDPGSLGARVVCEFVGALVGVATGWYWFSGRMGDENVASKEKSGPSSD